jgi:hypothetical protein
MAYVADNSPAHAEQKAFGQQLGTAMLNAI